MIKPSAQVRERAGYIGSRAVAVWRILRHKLSLFTPLRLAGELVLLLVALQLAVLGINATNGNKPILGLRLEGQLTGQLAGGDFRKQADAIANSLENNTLTVSAADADSTITLRQLGVDTDEKKLYTTLLAAGRTGNVFTRLADQDLAAAGARNISLGRQHFNTNLAKAYIATLDQKIDISPLNAYYAYEAQQVVVHPDAYGRAIDVESALQRLQNADPGRDEPIRLPTKQVPATVTAALLKPLLPQVQAIAQKPLTIAAGSSRITLPPEQLVGLVAPKVIPDPKRPHAMTAQITFDEAKLNAIVDGVVKQAVVSPQPTIMSGSRVVKQGKSGIRTEDSNSLARVLAVLLQRQTGAAAPDEASVPLVAVSPPVVQQTAAPSSAQTRTGTGLVRLTFDDGPGAYTEQILDILRRYNVRATFYVIGRNVERYPGTMQRIRAEGHRIGNHSYSHADLSRLSRAGVVQELSSTQAAIQAACGVTPTAFRPPYGALNGTVRSVAASMGMSVDLWSADTRDWAQPGSGAITRRALSGANRGAVVLLHVLHKQTVTALPSIIEGIRAQGYTLE